LCPLCTRCRECCSAVVVRNAALRSRPNGLTAQHCTALHGAAARQSAANGRVTMGSFCSSSRSLSCSMCCPSIASLSVSFVRWLPPLLLLLLLSPCVCQREDDTARR